MGELKLKSYEFRREREPFWRQLEALVAKVEARGIGSLSAGEVGRLPHLYRTALSSLGVARSISLDRNLLDYLETLAGRAYFCVYGTKRHLREILRDFCLRQFPGTVRRFRRHIGLAATFLVLGTLTGMGLTLAEEDRFYTFVSEEYAAGRTPTVSTEELREALYAGGGGAADQLTAFATFLFTHNAKIGMLSFALGFVAGFPVFLLLFINGLTLGAFAALYHGRGLGMEFWAWVLPHGLTELSAVAVCGGGGLVLAESLLFPGRHTRLENLAERGREAGMMVIGAVLMFLVAALLEGLFRQAVQSVPIRAVVALTAGFLWVLYFTHVGRKERP